MYEITISGYYIDTFPEFIVQWLYRIVGSGEVMYVVNDAKDSVVAERYRKQ